MIKKSIIPVFCWVFILLVFFSCKKDDSVIDEIEADPVVSPTVGTRREFTLDSIFLYAKQVYLWHDALPNYNKFEPRLKYAHIAADREAFQQELFDISQLKINTATNLPYEYLVNQTRLPKYSSLGEQKTIGNSASSGIPSINSIPFNSIINHSNKKIGYIVINSLPTLSVQKNTFDQIFNYFSTNGVNELIIDLRNNNGGYVKTAKYLADLIAPKSLHGQHMFTQEYSLLMQQGKATILQFQPYLDSDDKPVSYKGRMATLADVDYSKKSNTILFEKAGNLDGLEKICFIVSKKTASAAELLISIFQPYYTVEVVGEQTYGKPVGHFSMRIDNYSLLLPSFELKNADGWNDYFDGMIPNKLVSGLLADPHWGNLNEKGLEVALSALKESSLTNTKKSYIQRQNEHQVNSKQNNNDIIIDERTKKDISDNAIMLPYNLPLKK